MFTVLKELNIVWLFSASVVIAVFDLTLKIKGLFSFWARIHLLQLLSGTLLKPIATLH